VCNPNNPTGTSVSAAEFDAFVASLPAELVLVVDEAYREFARRPDFPDAIAWVARRPGTMVMRTFSKIYGLAGLRVGYAVSRPEVADIVNRVRQAFNVSSLAQVAACAALRDQAHVRATREMNTRGLRDLSDAVRDIGLAHPPSMGNFLLLDLARPARPVYEALLQEGIIVRPVANYDLPTHVRVTIGRPEHSARVVAALRKVLRPER